MLLDHTPFMSTGFNKRNATTNYFDPMIHRDYHVAFANCTELGEAGLIGHNAILMAKAICPILGLFAFRGLRIQEPNRVIETARSLRCLIMMAREFAQ